MSALNLLEIANHLEWYSSKLMWTFMHNETWKKPRKNLLFLLSIKKKKTIILKSGIESFQLIFRIHILKHSFVFFLTIRIIFSFYDFKLISSRQRSYQIEWHSFFFLVFISKLVSITIDLTMKNRCQELSDHNHNR